MHQARSTPLRQPGRRADLAGLAGLAGWDRGDRELRKDWKLSRRARAFPQLETHHQSRYPRYPYQGATGTGQSAFGKPSTGQARPGTTGVRYEGGAEETIAGTPRHSAARDTIPRSACHSSLPQATRAPAGRSWRCQERFGRDLHSATGAPCEVPTYMPGGRGTSGRQRQPDTPGERAWRERTLLLPGCLAGQLGHEPSVRPPARPPTFRVWLHLDAPGWRAWKLT